MTRKSNSNLIFLEPLVPTYAPQQYYSEEEKDDDDVESPKHKNISFSGTEDRDDSDKDSILSCGPE